MKFWIFYSICLLIFIQIFVPILRNYYYMYTYRNIIFEESNTFIINEHLSKNYIKNLIQKIDNMPIKYTYISLIINSNSGDILAVYDFINYMNISLERRIFFDCYAINVKSSVFYLFEFCSNKYILPDTILFATIPEITLIVNEEIVNNSFLAKQYVDLFESEISKKINIPIKTYKELVKNNLTIYSGFNAIKNHLADEIVWFNKNIFI